MVVGLKEEEGERKGRVMALVVVLFDGVMKKKVKKVMMKVFLEVEVVKIEVVLWW